MRVLIVSWNADNEKELKTINAGKLLPFIKNSVNAKKTGLFQMVDIYFFSFQEVGKKNAANNKNWNFLEVFNTFTEFGDEFKKDRLDKKGNNLGKAWQMVPMVG